MGHSCAHLHSVLVLSPICLAFTSSEWKDIIFIRLYIVCWFFVGQYNALQMHLEEMQCYSPYSWWNWEAHKRNSSWVSWLKIIYIFRKGISTRYQKWNRVKTGIIMELSGNLYPLSILVMIIWFDLVSHGYMTKVMVCHVTVSRFFWYF